MNTVKEQMRDERIDNIVYEKIRGALERLKFDVSDWEKRELLEGDVPVVYEGRPYDIKKKGPDVVMTDHTGTMIAEIKDATDPRKAEKFIEMVRKHIRKVASMYKSITERLRFAASLMLKESAALDPDVMKAIDELVSEGVILEKDKPAAEKEVLKILKPGKGWVPAEKIHTATLDPAMGKAILDTLEKKGIIKPRDKGKATKVVEKSIGGRIPAQHIQKAY